MTYNGRRGPNVTEFVNNLNMVPSAQDLQSSTQDDFSLGGDDLALWTNTEFLDDFALGHNGELQLGEFVFQGESGQAIAPDVLDMKPLDFEGDFGFPDFNFTQPAPQSFGNDAQPLIPAPLQTNGVYPAASSAGSPTLSSPVVGDKRRATSPENYEDASRVAAEEDKRRRNTAASARFRVKKKQREQALERSAKEMADKVSAFENRISQLETENKWLKSLITEKNDKNMDLPALWKKYNLEQGNRKGSERKDGVGTSA